jgi:hypothetical protein
MFLHHEKNTTETVDNLCTIEELLLANYFIQWTIVSAEGSCQKITLRELPFVHVRTGKLLIVNHGENTLACIIHDVPKNYYLRCIRKLL